VHPFCIGEKSNKFGFCYHFQKFLQCFTNSIFKSSYLTAKFADGNAARYKSDFTLRTTDIGLWRVHKFVLAAVSPYFEALFDQDKAQLVENRSGEMKIDCPHYVLQAVGFQRTSPSFSFLF
jgi:hypothetical protein